MNTGWLAFRVHLHAPRYHGVPEWPPAPARLFQALVAGAAPLLRGAPELQEALRWFEQLPAPTIGAPRHWLGQEVTLYVPNNDLDSVGGNPERLAEIRAPKSVRPRLLGDSVPFVYLWPFDEPSPHAEQITSLAHRIYQFGRGMDMAWATAEVLDDTACSKLLDSYEGLVHRPTPGGSNNSLASPCAGTFDSLQRRFEAHAVRFRVEGVGRSVTQVFVQPPKALFRRVAYDCPPARWQFDIRPAGVMERFAPVALQRAHEFVVRARDAAIARLVSAGAAQDLVEAVLLGRRPGEPERIPQEQRVRLIPLPSVGHTHSDVLVRRLLVEVPQGGPIAARDVRWAFSGLEVDGSELIEGSDRGMLARYMDRSVRWQTVTAAALPAPRRRIDPARVQEEAKGPDERAAEEARAISAARQALRHAGVSPRGARIRVQREPLQPHGERAEAFAAPPRFAKERLWHVEVELLHPVRGPIVLGDGRYLGLGVMVPVNVKPRVFAWRIAGGLVNSGDPSLLARSLRRAVIARAQRAWGERAALPDYITGHAEDGSPAANHKHLHFAFDAPRDRLLIVDRLASSHGRLIEALEGLRELRAGPAGVLQLERTHVDSDDPLVRPSRRWRTVTPYRVERHEKRSNVSDAIEADVRRACRALALPAPSRVEASNIRAQRRIGVDAEVALEFAVPVAGPLLLGRTRHQGGGLFQALDS